MTKKPFSHIENYAKQAEEEFLKEVEADLVNHPPHYTNGKIETIDWIEDDLTDEGFEGYCIGNAYKYLSRYRHKNGIQDIEKAIWYLNRFVERSKQNEPSP